MKKTLALTLCLFLVVFLSGCGGSANSAPAQTSTPEPSASPEPEKMVLDLTGMGPTMVYSYIFNIMMAPNDYIGQAFKLKGTYTEQSWDTASRTYRYIYIADAAACCAQGLEFELQDPEAPYPEMGEEFTLYGVFEPYYEDGHRYFHFTNARIINE